jgi:serine phosphatase RsbU (regulator of sigma subunit)
MNKFLRCIFTALFLILSYSFFPQGTVDSLLSALKIVRQDTIKVNILNKLGKELEFLDQKRAKSYLLQSLKLSEDINYLHGTATACKYLGYLAEDVSDLDSSTYFYKKSYDILVKKGDKPNAAELLKLIGDSYEGKGDYSTALSYLQRSLKAYEELDSHDGSAGVQYSLGKLYQNLGQNDNAMKAYMKCLELYKKLNKPIDIANALTAVGIMHNIKKDYKTAKEFYAQAKKIYEENNYDNGLSNLYTWMAITAYEEKNIDEALNYFMRSKELYEKLNNLNGLIYAYNNIGSLYADKKEYDKAIEFEKKSLEIALKSKGRDYIKYSYQILANTYAKKGDFRNAFEYQHLYMQYKDSVFNETSMQQINEMQTKYETEKKDKELLLKDAEITKQIALTDKQSAQRNYFLIGFALMLIVSALIFRSYRLKQKANTIIASQKKEVELQKELIEEKQKEIVDSITYAKRLQQAILPPISQVKQYLPESFILDKPKDIVSGDFYWMHINQDDIYIAAADCTGHGVPGAMVSVVCSNSLDRTVKEFGIREPGKILDKVRELVVVTFVRKDSFGEKSESEVKDGMDISLCRINMKTMELQWAGANNPLWMIQDNVFKEIKANKQPIGKTDTPQPFSTHSVALQKGDRIYLFTDGYADQFGGTKGKKFKYKPFQEQLISNSDKKPEEQMAILDKTIESWRGDLQQVDDILVIGIRI